MCAPQPYTYWPRIPKDTFDFSRHLAVSSRQSIQAFMESSIRGQRQEICFSGDGPAIFITESLVPYRPKGWHLAKLTLRVGAMVYNVESACRVTSSHEVYVKKKESIRTLPFHNSSPEHKGHWEPGAGTTYDAVVSGAETTYVENNCLSDGQTKWFRAPGALHRSSAGNC
jgi:hypothetical protein